MSSARPLEEVFERAIDDTDGDKVSVGDMLDLFGHRSFGPIFLVLGIIAVIPPIGAIPGLPAAIGLIVILFSAQMLMGMDHVWLPEKLKNASISKDKIEKAHDKFSGVLGEIDRFVTDRMEILTGGAARYVAAVIVTLMALAMIPMELLPFAAAAPGSAIALIGLGLMARDGAVMAFAFTMSAASIAVLVWFAPSLL